MRVLLVTAKDGGPDGDCDGGGRTTRDLVAQLSQSADACELHMLALREFSSSFRSWCESQGVRTITEQIPTAHAHGMFEAFLDESRRTRTAIAEIASQHPIDLVVIVHICNAFGLEEVLPSRVRLAILPMFTSPAYARTGAPPPPAYVGAERRALHRADLVVTPSKTEAAILQRELGCADKKIAVVPRTIDPGSCPWVTRVPPSESQSVRLISVAAARRQKNLEAAVQALALLRASEIPAQLTLSGPIEDPDYRDSVASLAKSLGVSKYVAWTGSLYGSALTAAFAKAHIGLAGTHEETFGRAVMEGLATGLPTVIFEDLDAVLEHLTPTRGVVQVQRPSGLRKQGLSLASGVRTILAGSYSELSASARAAVPRRFLSQDAVRTLADTLLRGSQDCP